MSNNKKLNELAQRIKEEVPISEVIEKYISLTEEKYKEKLGLCPFHNDTRLGSFKVNDEKKMFKCFSCDAGGDAITFVSKYRGITPKDAIFSIAKEYGLITLFEYDEATKGKRIEKTAPIKIKKIVTKKEKQPETERADVETLNKVYTVFLNNLVLSEKHEKELMENRGIDKNTILERKYKTFPSENGIVNILENMEDELGSLDILQGVPGFFQKKNEPVWEWKIRDFFGNPIIIPIKNANGLIVSLQLRVTNNLKEGTGKYLWLSGQIGKEEDVRYGVGSGAPLDILFPQNLPNNIIFITEGRFKAEQIVKELESTCISIGSITNCKGIDVEIKEIMKVLESKHEGYAGIRRIYIALDMDIYDDGQKEKSIINLVNLLIERLPDMEVFAVKWDKQYKGIDDLLLKNKKKDITKYSEIFQIVEINNLENKGGIKYEG